MKTLLIIFAALTVLSTLIGVMATNKLQDLQIENSQLKMVIVLYGQDLSTDLVGEALEEEGFNDEEIDYLIQLDTLISLRNQK